MKKLFAILMNKADDEGGSPAGGSPNGKVDDKQEATNDPSKAEESGLDIETDEFGYAIDQPTDEEGKKVQKAAPAKKSEQEADAQQEASKTGYEEDVVIPAEVPPVPPVEKPQSTQEKLGFELDFGDMDKATAEKVSDFAKANGLTQEAAQAFVNLKNSEIADVKAAREAHQSALDKEVLKLKSTWQKELKTDPDFGGEKFPQSLKNVDKVLSEFFPGIKKLLTEGNRMLPPIVMREMAKLHDHLYSTEKLVQGDPVVEVDESSDDPLDFYNS